MSERNDERTVLRISLAVLSVLVLLYSFVVLARPLMGVVAVLLLFGAYIGWQFFRLAVRFVVAFERIADAMERESEGGVERDRIRE